MHVARTRIILYQIKWGTRDNVTKPKGTILKIASHEFWKANLRNVTQVGRWAVGAQFVATAEHIVAASTTLCRWTTIREAVQIISFGRTSISFAAPEEATFRAWRLASTTQRLAHTRRQQTHTTAWFCTYVHAPSHGVMKLNEAALVL